jgi:hypothetical protein
VSVTSPDGTPESTYEPSSPENAMAFEPSTVISALRTYSWVAGLKMRPVTRPLAPGWAARFEFKPSSRRVANTSRRRAVGMVVGKIWCRPDGQQGTYRVYMKIPRFAQPNYVTDRRKVAA